MSLYFKTNLLDICSIFYHKAIAIAILEEAKSQKN